MAKPKMYYYENYEDVVLFSFKFNEHSKSVHDLQVFLGLKVDSSYGPKTKRAHIKYLRKHNLPLTGVPGMARAVEVSPVRAMGVSAAPASTEEVKRCPKWEKMLKDYGLPVKEFSYIMWRESRCQPKAIGWNYRSGMGHWSCKLAPADVYKRCKAVRSYDSGLLQINSSWTTVTSQACKSKWGDMSVLLNPSCNLAVAKYLYEDGGMHHWKATSGRYSG